MNRQEELRTGWALWNILADVTQHLWERYEDDFVKFCIEEEDAGEHKRLDDNRAAD